jgi:hypothetical protein
MNFKRVKVKGQNRKFHKTWKSEDKCYRITWRREFMGVSLPPRFQACVRIHLPNGWDMWDFAGRRGPFKTFKAASEACEHHRRRWSAIAQAPGIRRVLELCGGKVPLGYPLWVRKEINAKVRNILENANKPQRDREWDTEPDQSAPTEVLPSIEHGKPGDGDKPVSTRSRKRGRASPATVEDGTTTGRRRIRLTPTENKSDAPPAEAPVKGRKRQSSKRTARKSPGTGKRKKSIKRSSKRREPPSPN